MGSDMTIERNASTRTFSAEIKSVLTPVQGINHCINHIKNCIHHFWRLSLSWREREKYRETNRGRERREKYRKQKKRRRLTSGIVCLCLPQDGWDSKGPESEQTFPAVESCSSLLSGDVPTCSGGAPKGLPPFWRTPPTPLTSTHTHIGRHSVLCKSLGHTHKY